MSDAPRARPARTGPRVALVRSRFDAFGGAERFVQSAIAALSAQGASLTLVTRKWPDDDGSAVIVNPFHVGSLWRDRGFAKAVCEALAKRPFDLVQSHERIACCDVYRAGDGVHAAWLEQRARVQSALGRYVTAHSPHHRYLLAAERELFTSPRLKAVICNSEMVRGEIRERFATADDKLVLIRNAVDGARFHPGLREEFRDALRGQLKIPREASVFAYVGSGFERKGVGAFLCAVAAREEPAWAIIAGKDKSADRYGKLAVKLGIAHRVRFTGAVSDVRPFLAASDAFVLPTLYDPFPNAALEAMACGLPVVTSTKCGAAEIVREGESGFVRDALDVGALAQCLDRLDPETARRMGEAARESIAHLTPEAMGREYLALYERLLAGKLG
jgi:UDP-glucose:(heptosyl)LPS alpha-1,3-glucosyltransferase